VGDVDGDSVLVGPTRLAVDGQAGGVAGKGDLIVSGVVRNRSWMELPDVEFGKSSREAGGGGRVNALILDPRGGVGEERNAGEGERGEKLGC
jgi:hypothetical protein